jgi:acetyltransferase-like isoleucine patch superfamily enzyme
VVTKDVPPNTVVKGIPAKPMMTRKEYEDKRKAFIETHRKPII